MPAAAHTLTVLRSTWRRLRRRVECLRNGHDWEPVLGEDDESVFCRRCGKRRY